MSAVVTPTPPTTATTPPPAAPAAVGWRPYRWTIEAYRRLDETGLLNDVNVMLADGVIYAAGRPQPPHDVALAVTDDWLRTVFASGSGCHVRCQTSFVIGAHTALAPDLAVVPGVIRDYATRSPATAVLVVEVAHATLVMDTTTKAELYATAGVPDYWVLDQENRRLIVHRDPEPLPAGLGATAYRTRVTDGTVAPLAAPAATVRVADLLP